MSTPVVEQIAVKLLAAINAITIANGFNQDLTGVRPKRIHLENDLNKNNSVFISQDVGSASLDGNELIYWQQNFLLQALVIDSDDATDPIDIRCNIISADIVKQLMSETYYGFDGLLDAEWIDQIEISTGIVDGKPQSLVEVTLATRFFLKTINPYLQE